MSFARTNRQLWTVLKLSKADGYEDNFLQYTLVNVLYNENHKVLCYREKGWGKGCRRQLGAQCFPKSHIVLYLDNHPFWVRRNDPELDVLELR